MSESNNTPSFAVSRADFSSDREFYRALEMAFHEANGLSKREQACGLLSGLAHSAYTVSQAVSGQTKQPFTVNPISSLAFQMECLLELFPVTQEDIDKRQKNVVDVYYLNSETADKAIEQYKEQGIGVEKIAAVSIDGEDRYVLRATSVSEEMASKVRLEVGHYLYFPQQGLEAIDEPEWNPYFVVPKETPTVANDEEFGEQPFVGAGSDPTIVEASFEEGDASLDDITPPWEEQPVKE